MASRILIVDDHPLTREALSSLLKAHGFDVVGCASDGAEAIVEAGRLRPDLVLLDLSMPGLDGLSALPRLREAAPECEVVVLTASGTEENLLQAIRAACDALPTLYTLDLVDLAVLPPTIREAALSNAIVVDAG